MNQYPAYAIFAFQQAGYEHYAELLQGFARRWGGLELEAFIRALLEGEDQDQVFAILALGYEPTAWIRDYLLPFLQTDKSKQRWASALGLGKMREQQALPVLLSMLTECFPPEEKPAFKGDDLWIYNDWRRKAISVLRYWPQPEASGTTNSFVESEKQEKRGISVGNHETWSMAISF